MYLSGIQNVLVSPAFSSLSTIFQYKWSGHLKAVIPWLKQREYKMNLEYPIPEINNVLKDQKEGVGNLQKFALLKSDTIYVS